MGYLNCYYRLQTYTKKMRQPSKSFYFLFLYSLGEQPFILEKNLLNEGVSAKFSWSAIWVIVGKTDAR